MDEILSLLFNPDFQFGVIAGGSLASVGFVCFVALTELRDRHADRRQGDGLGQAEHLLRTANEIRFGGDLPAPPRVPDAANDATLDLRHAYRRPQGRRAEMRSGPR